MVNFRFHLVSLTAVFLALAIGILIGAEVIGQTIVEGLKGRIEAVDNRADKTNALNDNLEADIRRWQAFAHDLDDQPIAGRLSGQRLLLLGVDGIDRGPTDALRQSAVDAGASIDGTVWFTGKWRLTGSGDVQTLASVVGVVGEERADRVRNVALGSVSNALLAGEAGALLSALKDAGFIDFESGPDDRIPLNALPEPGASYVVLSGPKAAVSSDFVLTPLARLLALGGLHVLAAEPTRPVNAGVTKEASLVASLRKNGEVNGRLSTVDNVDDYRGRIAAILALEQLPRDRTGHYGTSGDNVKLLPSPTP